MIHREILPVSRTGAQWRDPQHIADESELLAVPGPDHRTRSGQLLLFFVVVRLIGSLLGHVLDQTIRPRDSYSIRRQPPAQIKEQRHAAINLLLIRCPGFQFNFGIIRQLQVLNTGKRHPDPLTLRDGHVTRNTSVCDRLRQRARTYRRDSSTFRWNLRYRASYRHSHPPHPATSILPPAPEPESPHTCR